MLNNLPAGLLFWTLFLSPLFEQARRPLQHVTPPAQIASLSASACGACHAALYEQWSLSRHAKSATNRIFAVSFRREPLRWCVYCHAPLPEQEQALRDVRNVRVGVSPIVDEGINCAVCHVRDGVILATRPPSPEALRAHPVRQTSELAEPQFCGNCHQFNFPRAGLAIRYSHEPMQNTLAEWRQTPRSKTCQECHMPQGAHRFPGGHDATLVRNSLSAQVHRLPDGRLHVELQASNVGHRVPTGDPFRRLRLHFYAEKEDAKPLSSYAFGRHFRKPPGADADTWVLAEDSSIPSPGNGTEAKREFDLPALPSMPEAGYWRLLLSYAAPGTLRDLRGDDIAIEIARGQVTSGP